MCWMRCTEAWALASGWVKRYGGRKQRNVGGGGGIGWVSGGEGRSCRVKLNNWTQQ